MPLRFSDDIPDHFKRRVARCQGDPGMAERLARKALTRFGTYEGLGLQEIFVTTQLPPGKVIISGAGPSTLNLLQAIENHAPGIQVVALVDRRAANIREALGYEVLTAQEAVTRAFDYAIVCNVLYEKSMLEDLLQAGLGDKKIVAVHSLEAFRRFHDHFVEDVIEKRLLAKILARIPRVDNVILVPSRDIWSVVDESALVEALPSETTIRLFFGPLGQLEISPQYPSFDVGQSLPLIINLLKQLNPKCVYVRGSAHFQAQHVAVAIKRALPEVFLAFEVYDYMCMFDAEILNGWALNPISVEDNCCAEALLGLQADFIFDKTPGDGWRALTSSLMTAPRQPYFPRLRNNGAPSCTGAHTSGTGPMRLLCAGTIPEFKHYRPGYGFLNSVFQDIIRPIELLSESGDYTIDIFNSGHISGNPWCEREYAGYRAHFNPQRVSYNPGLPFDQLLAKMGEYDFGILLFSPTEMVIDYPLQESLPNRFMGYVSGDLPIIINKEIRYSASLVERFHAGITIGAEEMNDLPRRIREADLPRMREGVKALRHYMQEHNKRALIAFKDAIAARLEGCPQ